LHKIIILGSIPPPYIGPNVATKIILNSELKKKFNLIHLDTSDHRDLSALGAIDFINLYLALKHYSFLIWMIITRRPGVVYIPLSQTTLGYLRDGGFILISKLFRRKVICHLRGGNFKNWFNSTNVVMRSFVRIVHSLVDGQIVLGEKLKHLFYGIISDKKIHVVPNGGNFDINYKGGVKTRLTILYLANFDRTKGILDTLNATPEVYRFCEEVEFIFAGDFIHKDVKQEVDLFLKGYRNIPIKFEGPVYGEKKDNILASSDIFVFPTYYPPEGHPWVILEAMAAGLPIITTDQGAITESVIDGVNGFIVEKRNPEQIAEKIKLLIENPQLRQRMGRESRRLYLENFTEKKMVERLTSVFYKVLEN